MALQARELGVRVSAGLRNCFLFQGTEPGCGTRSAYHSVSTKGSFTRSKEAGALTLTTDVHLASKLRTSIPPYALKTWCLTNKKTSLSLHLHFADFIQAYGMKDGKHVYVGQ